MTIQKLASALCKLEGKKSQIKIGDMREALRLLCELEAKSYAKSGEWNLKKSPAALLFLEGNKKFHKGKPTVKGEFVFVAKALK